MNRAASVPTPQSRIGIDLLGQHFLIHAVRRQPARRLCAGGWMHQRQIPAPAATCPPTWTLTVPGAGAAQHEASPAGGEYAHPLNTKPHNSNRIIPTMVAIRAWAGSHLQAGHPRSKSGMRWQLIKLSRRSPPPAPPCHAPTGIQISAPPRPVSGSKSSA